ncbi:MAG: archease [Anaerolineae bacterium]
MGYAEVSHTADVAIRAWGPTVAELLVAAAQGMFAQVNGDGDPSPEREVEVSAPDLESLLVDWLSELLYLSEVNREVYESFDVSVEPEWRLRATVKGRGLGSGGTKVKAVTYHGLSVTQEEGDYVATVVFDT